MAYRDRNKLGKTIAEQEEYKLIMRLRDQRQGQLLEELTVDRNRKQEIGKQASLMFWAEYPEIYEQYKDKIER